MKNKIAMGDQKCFLAHHGRLEIDAQYLADIVHMTELGNTDDSENAGPQFHYNTYTAFTVQK